MLWPAVTPAVLTFWALVALVVLATLAAPKLGAKRSRMFAWMLLLAPILFIPSCTAVMTVMNRFRFGTFQFETFATVQDDHISGYLPPAATDITVDARPYGYRARFTISEAALDTWFQQTWKQFSDASVEGKTSMELKQEDPKDINRRFHDLNWPAMADAVEYIGPYAPNGAGFTIWYSPSQRIGYQEVAYW